MLSLLSPHALWLFCFVAYLKELETFAALEGTLCDFSVVTIALSDLPPCPNLTHEHPRRFMEKRLEIDAGPHMFVDP